MRRMELMGWWRKHSAAARDVGGGIHASGDGDEESMVSFDAKHL